MSDKSDRNPWDERYPSEPEPAVEEKERAETAEPSESTKMTETAEASKTSKRTDTTKSAESKETSTIRERKNVNMYLPEGLVDDLQLRYSELNVQWRREHGDDLPKNEQFYPAVIRASLTDSSIEAELGISE